MGGITTAFPDSLKAELPQAIHNFTASTGDVFKAALVKVGPTGTYDHTTTNYSDLTGNGDEVTGTGYTAGGFAWTAAQNVTPQLFGTEAGWQPSVNAQWTGASFSTIGTIWYNSSKSNRATFVGNLGGTFTVAGGTFTLVLPVNGAGTSVLALT